MAVKKKAVKCVSPQAKQAAAVAKVEKFMETVKQIVVLMTHGP